MPATPSPTTSLHPSNNNRGHKMKHLPPLKLALYAGMILGFVMLESPVILLANRIEPVLLGMPFLLWWSLLWWAFLTAVFLVAYLTDWGSRSRHDTQAQR